VPLIPLVGHRDLRRQLTDAITRDSLPSSLLFHGPRGVGKQRLALWLGQYLLCSGPADGPRPCGTCVNCRFAESLAHPDLRWFFPRPRAESDASASEVTDDLAEALSDRLKAGGLYAAPSGTEGIFVASVRALVQLASQTPALARRKVYIVGDAERMVPQEGAEFAANAFLKLLEEPPADTVIILTTSEPGALLPTIRSRVIAVRVPLLPERDVRELVEMPSFSAAVDDTDLPKSVNERIRLAAGAPGTLLGAHTRRDAMSTAAALLQAADGSLSPPDRVKAVMSLGASRSRGPFTDALDALTAMLRERARGALGRGDAAGALAASRAIDVVLDARVRANGNVSPQLLASHLVRELRGRLS